MAKVFISQPMNGLTDEQIKTKRAEAVENATDAVHNHFGADEPVEILGNFFEGAPHDAKPLWFLGEAFKILSNADVAYFCEGWEDARGCRIENTCSHEYGIPLIFEETTDGSTEVCFNK